ncbi:hypothetical protein NQ315_008766 [Exocentrus adspersus]|uniref:DDE Tnp4 domain-containing protein n=1 Tax=Exocentrus adspersus TaxID=1586481 RepID=A0AAV8VGQ4_9CUCU|nr:hypothetical protein NQ315_008766 [Exocentrus adspersus]
MARSLKISMTDILFKKTFRFTKDMAQYILNTILPDIDIANNVVAVPAHLKFFAALYFYATGSYQRLIGQSFNVTYSQPVVSRSVTEVTNSIINRLADEWIQFPINVATKNSIKAKFMETKEFPGIIGSIDCFHIAIVAPQEEEHNYLNRKQYHSKNVQVICDYDLKILNVNAQYPGATHDSFVWRNSFVRRYMEKVYNEVDHNSWLLRDSGYPQQPWLMTPFLNAQPNTPEANYNYAHIRARNKRVLRYTPEKASNIIKATAILHNFCINGNLDIDFEIPEQEPAEGDVDFDNNRNILREGQLARRNLVQAYFANN